MLSHTLIVVTLVLTTAAPLVAKAQSAPARPGAAPLALGSGWIGRACVGHACVSAADYRMQLRRELRFQELREGGAGQVPTGQALPRADLRPPTPEAQIQPGYRQASQIRPEFLKAQDPHARPAQP